MTTLRSNAVSVGIAAASGSSVLANAAAGMTSGQWLQLTGANLPAGLNKFTALGGASAGSTGFCIVFGDKFARDPIGKKFYFVGQDHYGLPGPAGCNTTFLMYDDATNAWTSPATPPWGTTPGGGATPAHMYENTAFDTTRQKFWHRYAYGGGTMYRWDGGSTWFSGYTDGNLYGNNLGSLTYFPEMDRLVYYGVENGTNGGLTATNPATGAHTSLVSSSTSLLAGTGDYQYFNRYSAARQRIFFGGGNGSNRCWSYSAAGVLTRHDDMPLSINVGGNGSVHCFINPANGNLVAYGGVNSWRELNPTASAGSQWSTKSGTVGMLASNTYDGSAYGSMSCETEYGVVAFVKAYSQSAAAQMWLWKP